MTRAQPTMKALTFKRYGPPDVVRVEDVPRPVPKPGEVFVRVYASAVNTSDWRIRAAAFPGITALPARMIFGVFRPRNTRLGSEYAGVVDAIGSEVTKFEPGQRVFGISSSGGASAEYLTVPEEGAIAEIPDGLSFAEAAALPFGGLAAVVFLEQFAKLRAGQSIMIVGASGGVGAYAVQVANALDAHVTAVSGPNSQTFVRGLGAERTINYQTTDLADIEGRFHVIVDAASAVTPRVSRRLLHPNGLFLPLNIGWSELAAALLNPLRNRKIRLAVNRNTEADLQRLVRMVRDGKIKPVVDTIYPLARASDAHAHVETRHRKGAIILSILPEPRSNRAIGAQVSRDEGNLFARPRAQCTYSQAKTSLASSGRSAGRDDKAAFGSAF